jgi:CelD/BcsL family acetyltransferase involved in cellulose biosynthesis
MRPLACAVIRDVASLEAMRDEWSALLARAETSEPTLSPAWLLGWWRVFGGLGGRALRVALFYSGRELVGLAPLQARVHWYRPGLPFRRLELLASGEDEADEICSDYVGVIAARGFEEPVAHALAAALAGGALGGWDELVMPAMDGSRALPSLVVGALNQAGVRAESRQTGAAPYIPLPSSWDAYLKQLPSSRRYLVNRSLRDFEKWAGGPGELVVVKTRAELDEGKRVLQSLHGERWGAEGRSGVFLSSRFAAFHDALMPALLDDGALELAWLAVRGEPIAVVYNIVWNGKVYFYQSGRKIDLPKGVRPGIVIHALAIQRAIAAGRREYDFLAGTSQYKTQLALAERPLVEVRAVRARLRERARRLADDGIARARALRDRLRPPPADREREPERERE